jgi:putative transcriptional regulator
MHSLQRLLAFRKRTLEQGEQGRREPSGAAQKLLNIAEGHPEVLLKVAADARAYRRHRRPG